MIVHRLLFAVLCGLTFSSGITPASRALASTETEERFAAQAQTTLGANEPPIFDAARLGTAVETNKILKADPAMRDARNQLGSTPLHLAATNGDAGPLKALIAAGAEVNARDKEDNTPLHMAAYAGKSQAARLLLEAGADVNAKSTGGRTPLSLARKARADETAGIISLWVLKGCKPGKPC